MPKMVIAFDADNARIGKTVDMEPEVARVAVREGRARYANEADEATSGAPTDQPPVPTAADSTGEAPAPKTSRKR